mmetsp:Transcript_13409/g.13468  ORF Transcript_13409/g.13468 Transcript_13409/m.13468 type:complete len:319 (+) Transcript_13409:80-1036(+)
MGKRKIDISEDDESELESDEQMESVDNSDETDEIAIRRMIVSLGLDKYSNLINGMDSEEKKPKAKAAKSIKNKMTKSSNDMKMILDAESKSSHIDDHESEVYAPEGESNASTIATSKSTSLVKKAKMSKLTSKIESKKQMNTPSIKLEKSKDTSLTDASTIDMMSVAVTEEKKDLTNSDIIDSHKDRNKKRKIKSSLSLRDIKNSANKNTDSTERVTSPSSTMITPTIDNNNNIKLTKSQKIKIRKRRKLQQLEEERANKTGPEEESKDETDHKMALSKPFSHRSKEAYLRRKHKYKERKKAEKKREREKQTKRFELR